jgi:hypothetical protein
VSKDEWADSADSTRGFNVRTMRRIERSRDAWSQVRA